MTIAPSNIDYNHSQNRHTLQGAMTTLSAIFGSDAPQSLLDVGCGTGTWMRAATELGVSKVFGVDGIIVGKDELHVSTNVVEQRDLTIPFNLGRRFDLTICLEVAEHLPESAAASLITSVTLHSDKVLFSAACPGQDGQHHVNCQWPSYWQDLFNANGFACEDSVRWLIWDNPLIEPWYRQNIFLAQFDRQGAGNEPRIKAVVHPEFLPAMSSSAVRSAVTRIERGAYPLSWYLSVSAQVAVAKVGKKMASWLK